MIATTPAAISSQSSSASPTPRPVVLILGAAGLDRLLTVPRYPQADAKVRTTSHFEVGGGNAANTAQTTALLAKAKAFNTTSVKQQDANYTMPTASALLSPPPPAAAVALARLCSKVGDDDIGHKVVYDLQKAGVDLSCPLFQVAKGTTTGLTTIIVSETPEHTRTCLYTPGSCGELSLAEAKQLLHLSSSRNDDNEDDNEHDKIRLNAFFQNVVHFHADARHTYVALFLARHAAKRGISVSVDVEKDRGTAALDQLVQVADIVFTNNGPPVQDYFNRMAQDKRQEEQDRSTAPHLPTTESTRSDEIILSAAVDHEMKTYASALSPNMFFTRWYNQVGKEVIVTQGSRGAVHIVCDSIVEEAETKNNNDVVKPTINKLEMIVSSQQQHGQKLRIRRRLQHTFSSSSSSSSSSSRHSLSSSSSSTNASTTTTKVATYSIHTTGVLQDIKKVVDTTGAGDAFIGAFLLFRIAIQQQQQPQQQQERDDDGNNKLKTTTTTTTVSTNNMLHQQQQYHQNCLLALDFAAWVAGRKVQGPGARMALPTARDVDEMLGISLAEIQESLGQLIGPFQF